MGRSEGKGSCYVIKVPLTNEKWIDDKLNKHFSDCHDLYNACIAEARKRIEELNNNEDFKANLDLRNSTFSEICELKKQEQTKEVKEKIKELTAVNKECWKLYRDALSELGISNSSQWIQTLLLMGIKQNTEQFKYLCSSAYGTICKSLALCFDKYVSGKGDLNFKSRRKGDYFSVVNGSKDKRSSVYNGSGLYIDNETNKFFVVSKWGSGKTYKLPVYLTPDDTYILKNLSRAFDMDYVPETKEQLKSFMIELKEKCIANGWQKDDGICVFFDSIRFCGLQQEFIRGKRRYNLLLTLDGTPLNKYENCLENAFTNVCGIDIGTQTVVCTYRDKDGIVFATEVHELVPEIDNDYMRKLANVTRSMESKRRYNNPQNYNGDGTISKGKKEWVYSNTYFVKKAQYNALNRSKTETTDMRQGELIKHILGMAHNIVIEDMNWKALTMRAKKTKTPTSKKKRFGKSILKKSPGGFMTRLESEVKSVGGTFTKAEKWDTRASQYNHQLDTYIKKSLGDRDVLGLKYKGSDVVVQRDLYSSFLLANMNIETKKIDKSLCNKGFDSFVSCHNKIMGELRKAFDKNELSGALKNILDLKQLKQF